MQAQVEQLCNKVDELIHLDDTGGMVCMDDFTRLNREIYELINVLWDRQGRTVDEEAQICLGLLMGFRVCMYADTKDEKKRITTMKRIKKVLKQLSALHENEVGPESKKLLSFLF